MDIKNVATQMRQEAKRLFDAANLIDPLQPNNPAPTVVSTMRKRTGARRMSAATRKKLSEGQQRRRARERGEIPQPQTQAA